MGKTAQQIIRDLVKENINAGKKNKKPKKKINETFSQLFCPDGAPYSFIDDEDFVSELTAYAKDAFAQDRNLKKLREYMAGIRFDNVCTESMVMRKRKDGKWVIVFNTDFVKYLLEQMVVLNNGDDWEYDPNGNNWPDVYFALFKVALLWGSYMSIAFDTQRNAVGGLSYKTNPKRVVVKAEQEMYKVYAPEAELIREFVRLKDEYEFAK